ncbi:hypothetical protein KM043_002216 [Ampulex compressa]|nr:hypothetical protein KM043_002216 [Ampulex compressa]
MDTFEAFVQIFERAMLDRSSSALTDILKDGRRYFQNISRDDSELVLSMLFDKNKGLLQFLGSELKRSIPKKGFDTAIKEAFHFLEFILEQFHDTFVPYITETKELCQLALTTRCSAYIQKAASSTFNKLIKLFSEYDLQLDDTIKVFVSKFHLLDIKERSLLFSVLGTIIKYNSEILQDPAMSSYPTSIFNCLHNDFKKQYKPQLTSQPLEIQIYLDVLSDIMNEISPQIKEKFCEQLYDWIKTLSPPDKYQIKKVVMRSAINLLSRHMNLFDKYVYSDYKFWYNLFYTLAQESTVNGECGQQALRSFYRTIGTILNSKDSEEDKVIFLRFMKILNEQLKTHTLKENQLSLTIYGFSQMAGSCKKFLTNDDVKNMFSLIAHCTVPLYCTEELRQVHLDNVCVYQEALSEIISHITDPSIDQITVFIKLGTFLIKRFPDLSVTGQTYTAVSLIKTIISIGSINKNLLEEYLYNLICDGIIWSSSHTLLVDAELQRGLNGLEERPTCYKNYLPLWLRLLKPSEYKSHGLIAKNVADTTFQVCITLIGKFNLTTKAKDNNVLSDAALSHTAINEADFRIFVNLVDLYVDIINGTESSLMENMMHKFLYKIISMSYKYPLISGFYKLVRACFQHIHNLNENQIDTEMLALLYKYLSNTLELIPTFANELLNACLYLVLDIPLIYTEHLLNRTVPIFKIAFTMGLSNFELARKTLNTLEKWMKHLNGRHMKEFLHNIVFYLEPYLRSKESSTELLQDIIKTERKVIKHIVLVDNENTLESLQRRMLLFLSSLDSEIVMDFIYKRSLDIGASWDKKDLLKYTIPFPDIRIDIYFDKILARLFILVQSAGDRRTKVIACEVLHGIVTFVLGKTSQHLMSDPDRFTDVYKRLYPVLLNLGCDSDEVVRQLFQPLMLQLTHWLSSQFMLESPATVYLLDSLFKGLSNDANSSLREFSGMCLAHFTEWSMKQSRDEGKIQTNIWKLMHKITNFALHPFVHKRVAAATAFNHLYRILREDEETVMIYWLEIFYCFVKSLDGCNRPSIINALDHVERVLKAKQDVLNIEYPCRRKPVEFEGATLTDAMNWLLIQCGCLDEHCRAKCMDLYVNICEVMEDYGSAKGMMQNYIDKNGIDSVYRIILENLNSKMESISFNDILPLLKCLEYCIWLITKDIISIDALFAKQPKKDIIFDAASNFVHLINAINTEGREVPKNANIVPKDTDDLHTLQCKTIITMFNFIRIILDFDKSIIPQFFLNTELFELITKCIMCPQVLGFDVKNLEIAEALPLCLTNLLHCITQKKDSKLLANLQNQVSTYVDIHIHNFFNLDEILYNTHHNELKPYVKGLMMLKNCTIFINSVVYKKKDIFKAPENKVECIFKILIKEQMGNLICANINSSALDYLQCLMKFWLMHYEVDLTKMLIKLITNDTLLGPDLVKVKHGLHFLKTFKDEIFKYMLLDSDKTVELLVELLQTNPSYLFTITEELLLFAQRNKKEVQGDLEVLVNAIILKFVTLERAVNNLEERKQKLINIYGIAVHLKEKPTEALSMAEELYAWILKQLTGNYDIEYKVKILKNFLICLTDMTSDNKPELVAILRTLRNDRLATYSTCDPQSNANALKVFACFHILLTLLPITKSLVVYESVILFAAGAGEELYNEKTNEYLEKYFNCISSVNVLKSLEVAYKLFMDLNTNMNDRFDVLYKFSLPAFEFCNTDDIECFFERNIEEIFTIVLQSFIGNDADMKQLLVSKIGCYNLLGIMFAKVPLRKIDSVESIITRNAIENVKTGKELVQQIYANALKVRMLKTSVLEHKELMRQLHCAAYNCSIAIVSLKDDEDSYLSIFAENRKKEQLIWDNIVDCNKQYNLQQTFKEYPKNCKKLVNIRKMLNRKQNVDQYMSYIHSYNLANSTLAEDINAYDLNQVPIAAKADTVNKEESITLTFESDDLNNHECMASICGVLNHMINSEISILPTTDNITMPKWMKCFRSSMFTDHNNVRLFMLKVILNTQNIFKPYAQFFLAPVMYSMHTYLKTCSMNYIVTDVLLMLLDWHTVAHPKENEDKLQAQKLLEVLIDKVMVYKTNDISTSIYKYNIGIIRMLFETWHDYLTVPENLGEKMQTAPDAAIHLILICLVNKMEKDMIRRDDVIEFLQKSLENWQNEEETVLRTCECLGLVLKFMDESSEYSNKKCEIIDRARSTLRQMQLKFENRQIKCIRAICKNYPSVGTAYFEFIIVNIFKVNVSVKANCLEIFLLCIPKLTAAQILKELGYMKFSNILKNKIPSCERIALQIIDTLVPVLKASDLLTFVRLVPPYAKSEFSEYRKHVYSIFTNVYKIYSTNISDSEDTKELINMSKEILISGLLDPAENLQEEILKFWTQDVQLLNQSKDRLLEILNTYTPNAADAFLPFIILTLLDLTRKTQEYTQIMFEPLHNCNYKDYKIAISWRTKNLGSMAPLFAPSLAGQITEMFSEASNSLPATSLNLFYTSAGKTADYQNYQNPLQLAATQDLEFEPTVADEALQSPIPTSTAQYDGVFKIPQVPQPIHNKKSKRFLSNSSEIIANIRQREIKRNIRRAEMIKEEAVRQRSSVKLYRNYRIGDFPDTEIAHSKLIEPLMELIKKDQLICKDLAVSIFCSLLKNVNVQEPLDEFTMHTIKRLKYIVENRKENSPIIGAVLEVLFAAQITDYSAEVIAKVSKQNGLNFLGTLLIEESITNARQNLEPPKKKLRSESANNISSKWLQLASLYQSMNDVDVVLSIFKCEIHNQEMKEAAFAEAANDWVKAKNTYKAVYDAEIASIEEHSLQRLLDSFDNLSCWSEIGKHIDHRLHGNLNNIWKDEWKDWMFPWLFESYVHRLLESDESSEFNAGVKTIESWLDDKKQLNYIKRVFGQELAMFFVYDKREVACDFLVNTLDEIRDEWIRLNPLSTESRISKLQKLRAINDINEFLNTLKSTDFLEAVQNLLKFWNNSLPIIQDALLPWDKLISYRMYFAAILRNKLSESEENNTPGNSGSISQNEDVTNVIHNLNIVSFNLQQKLINVALAQKNKFIAHKYLREIEQQLSEYPVDLKHQFLLTGAKIKYLSGKVESDMQKKVSYFASSWKYSQRLLKEDDLRSAIVVNVRQHISRIATKIVQLSRDNKEFASALTRSNTTLEGLDINFKNLDGARDILDTCSYNHLKTSCELATTNKKKCYFALSKYCYNRLSSTEDSGEISNEFIHSTLKAMGYGSFEAAHYFPCLLKPEYFEVEGAEDIFLRESSNIQTWLFLSWQAQLFSHLGTPIAHLIIPILERIVETYPNAVVYTFRLTVEMNPTLLNDTRTYKIRQALYDKPEVEKFLTAMEYVVQPELYLKYHLSELVKNLSQGKATAIDELLKKVYPSTREDKNAPRPGSIYTEISKYRSEIKALLNKKVEDIKQLEKNIVQSLLKRKDKIKLKDYSPWLHDFCGGNLEVPGQYTGDRKPMPQYHAKIMKIEPIVKVMQSLRKPVRITMVGNDGKEYNFLVKFGEDLRLDQRLQQLFTIMNKTLRNDAVCNQRRLAIDTYQVVPLSRTLGIIQWVDDTRPLQDLINFTLSKQKANQYDSIARDYSLWIRNAAPSKIAPDQYKEATIKTFITLCPSPESFVKLRYNFITTYATMCVAHWILGIGDRHLGNTLVTIHSGRCLGIDFGLAFGAGIDQRVPELMPFRLTPQILGLLRPFTENDLLGTIMIHTLRALRNEKGPILASMDVFVHEPLNWTENINKALDEDEDQSMDVKWLPKKKISTVTKKLDGIKPSLIMLEQLREQHNDKYFERYYTIVNGDDGVKKARVAIPNEQLTPEKQIECLLDQATDLNVLGRTYVGWKPWL